MMLVLASQSASRAAMLDAAGVAFEAVPAALDERALEAELVGASAAEVALALAGAKARAVAQLRPEGLVLGSDSLIEVNGLRYDKPRSKAEAAEHLRRFSSQIMHLHSAAVLVHKGAQQWHHASEAVLTVRALGESFIDEYLAHEWPAVSGCVGVFRIEGRGVQLFDSIEGDHFTVLGMPLLAVLGALREFGVLPR